MKQRADGRWVKSKTINGKRIDFYSKEKTERAALKDIEYQMIEYSEQKQRIKTFGEFAEEWKYQHIEEISYKTWQGYNAHYKRAVEEFGEKPIDGIAIPDIQKYVNRLAKQKFAHKTVKSALNVVSLIFDYAIMERKLDFNPCQYVKIPQGLSRNERELPDETQITKVINGVNCHFGEFAYLLLHTGLRRGEALALHSDNIDFDKKLIYVKQSVYFKSNRPELKPPKTEAGKREVFLLDSLIPILKDKKGFIFGGESPMTEQAFRRAWERYMKESGVTITPHQLRHAYATVLYENNIDAKSAQKLLGHSDYKVTLQIYTHISQKKKDSDFEKLNAWSNQYQVSQKTE